MTDIIRQPMMDEEDLHQSIKIIRQCLKELPDSPFRAKLPPMPRGPPGELYKRAEAGRGALGHYIVSDGAPRPY
ncbi:MAG: hypothetical protein JO297_01395 [Nitrososphaeraceae archaeon]|nr:hypothetical protein [Nitrososphaeraceae archaeon]